MKQLCGNRYNNREGILENVFHAEALKFNYYNLVKKGYKLTTDLNNKKKIEFFEKCNSRKVIPLPSFTKIKDQTLYLT